MRQNGIENTEATATISKKDLLSFVQDFQAVLWRVEIPRSRIEILNDIIIEGLEEYTHLFVKNAAFRESLLEPKEKKRVDIFFENMKEYNAATTVFRVPGKSGEFIWLKLCGTRSSCDPDYYHGCLVDVTDTATQAVAAMEEKNGHVASDIAEKYASAKPHAAVELSQGDHEYNIDIADALNETYARLQAQESCDALLFSDVHIRKNMVTVYFSGKPFEMEKQGESYLYAGTVAQDIVRYELDYLIVDDTMDSIKPIDWALFVPQGIRSYYAKPYYVRGVLRSVLVICSKRKSMYTNRHVDSYNEILEPFMQTVRNWRRQTKASS
jgi:hypothetical protein